MRRCAAWWPRPGSPLTGADTLAGHPVPSASQVQAAQQKVNQRAAALGKQEEQLAQANAKLTDLQNQAEILTENYDKAQVSEQQAQSALHHRGEEAGRGPGGPAEQPARGGALAANEYETQGGFDPMAACWVTRTA